MIVQVTNTYLLDTETGVVSDLKSFVGGVEVKKPTTTKKKKDEKPAELEAEAIITLDTGKLIFNNKAVADMKLQHQDRVVVKYEKIKGTLIPTIGKDIDQQSEGSGNKVTKTNTVSYRGTANAVLAAHGTEFGITEFKPGIWQLIPKNEGIKPTPKPTYKQIEKEASDLDITIPTEDDDKTDLDEMTFTL